MELTLAQKQTLRVYLIANLSELPTDQHKANALNVLFSPDYFAWRWALGRHDLTDQQYIGDDGIAVTSFVWGGSNGGYINRSQGERDAFRELFNSVESCYPRLANVRTAFNDIFSGAGAGAAANRAHFRAASRRPITVGEKVLAIATVGGPSQSGARGTRTNPDTLTAEGLFTADDVINALTS